MLTSLLGVLAIVLLFVIVFYIAKTSELSSIIREEEGNYEYASKVNGLLLLGFLVVFMAGIFYSGVKYIPRMLPESASYHGVKTDQMFNITTVITFVVFIITQVLLFWFAFRYRFKKERKGYFFPHNNLMEIIWTSVPAVVLTFLVFKGISTWTEIFDWQSLEEQDHMVVEVTGKQFGWIVRYPGEDGALGKRDISHENINGFKETYDIPNELGIDWNDIASQDDIYAGKIYLVKDKPVLFKLGALDVIHSFYLPHFRVKMDCVPGIPTQFMFTPKYTTKEYKERLKGKAYWEEIHPETGKPRWETFKFELACAELCGRSHYAMQKDVVVVTQEEYDRIMMEQTPLYDLAIAPTLAKFETENVDDSIIIEEEEEHHEEGEDHNH